LTAGKGMLGFICTAEETIVRPKSVALKLEVSNERILFKKSRPAARSRYEHAQGGGKGKDEQSRAGRGDEDQLGGELWERRGEKGEKQNKKPERKGRKGNIGWRARPSGKGPGSR
jgi:hypothetical protein